MTLATPEKTVDQNVVFFTDGHYAGVPEPRMRRFAKGEDSVYLYMTGLPIFRSGTFRDSMGWEHTYETEHMHMLKSNFDILVSRGVFKDVPVRKGHPNPFTNSMDELIGYVRSLSVQNFASPIDGQVYSYLMADFEVLDEGAAQKIADTLWRNRSSEIGSYVTNGESEFWPALLGFAYVDIPAVEGLNFSKFDGVGDKFAAIIDQKGSAVTDEKTNEKGGTGNSTGAPVHHSAPAQSFTFNLATGAESDFAKVQAYVSGLEVSNKAMEGQIAQFESDKLEAQKGQRRAFVNQLATDNKIIAPMVPGLCESVDEMSDTAWEKFKAAYESAPVTSLLGNHVVTGEVPTKTPEEQNVEAAQVKYNRLKMGNVLSADELAATPSAQVLKAAGKL